MIGHEISKSKRLDMIREAERVKPLRLVRCEASNVFEISNLR